MASSSGGIAIVLIDGVSFTSDTSSSERYPTSAYSPTSYSFLLARRGVYSMGIVESKSVSRLAATAFCNLRRTWSLKRAAIDLGPCDSTRSFACALFIVNVVEREIGLGQYKTNRK